MVEQAVRARFDPDVVLIDEFQVEIEPHLQSGGENQRSIGAFELFPDSFHILFQKLFHLTEVGDGRGKAGFRIIQPLIPAVDVDLPPLRHGADEGGMPFQQGIFRIVKEAVGQKIVQICDDPVSAERDGEDDQAGEEQRGPGGQQGRKPFFFSAF